jgi:hypothetical protein
MMHPVANEDATRTRMPAWMLRAGVLATLLFAMVAAASAQTINGDLSGIVVDGFGARVTKARVTLQNDKTKDVRNAVTNREGIYQFIAVPTGTYRPPVFRPTRRRRSIFIPATNGHCRTSSWPSATSR